MIKDEAIESIKKISEGLLEVKFVSLESVIDIVSQIHEPQKPVIPKFVAEWIEELKNSHSNLAWVWQVYPNEPKIKKWLDSNTEKFMRAWLDGYEVEKEKKYTVKINLEYGQYLGRYFLDNLELTPKFKLTRPRTDDVFTRTELEEIGYGNVFDNPMFEVEEVE